MANETYTLQEGETLYSYYSYSYVESMSKATVHKVTPKFAFINKGYGNLVRVNRVITKNNNRFGVHEGYHSFYPESDQQAKEDFELYKIFQQKQSLLREIVDKIENEIKVHRQSMPINVIRTKDKVVLEEVDIKILKHILTMLNQVEKQ